MRTFVAHSGRSGLVGNLGGYHLLYTKIITSGQFLHIFKNNTLDSRNNAYLDAH